MAHVKQEQPSQIYEHVEDTALENCHNHQIPRGIIEQIEVIAHSQNGSLVHSQPLHTTSQSPISTVRHQESSVTMQNRLTVLPAIFANHRQSQFVTHREVMQSQRPNPEIIQNSLLIRQDNVQLIENHAQMKQNGLLVTQKPIKCIQGMNVQNRAHIQNEIPLPIQIKSEAPEANQYFYHQIMQAYTGNDNLQVDQGTINQQPGVQTIPFICNSQSSTWPSVVVMHNDSQPDFYQAHSSNSDSEEGQSVAHKAYDYELVRGDSEETINYNKSKSLINQWSKNENDPSVYNKLPNSDDAAYKSLIEAEYASIKGEYTCLKCNDIHPTKRALKQHLKYCPKNTEVCEKGKVTCSQCPYICQSPAILKIHERTHTGEKPFSCSMCDYRSGQKNNVAKHILVHMKEKPFKCQYCEYRCAQKNNLVVHERTHTGFKPFACTLCDYKTVQKPNLVKHMYLHTGQKPFSCDQCSYRCVQKTNLTKHKLRHLNEKPGEHVVYKNVDRPYRPRQMLKCQMCTFTCVKRPVLERHLAENHKISELPVCKEGDVALIPSNNVEEV